MPGTSTTTELQKCSIVVTKHANNGGKWGELCPERCGGREAVTRSKSSSRGGQSRLPLPSPRPAGRGPFKAGAAPRNKSAAAASSLHSAATALAVSAAPLPPSAPPPPAAATMPMFTIQTNVCKDAVPDSLLGELTQQLAKATGKPAQVRAGGGAGATGGGRAAGAAPGPGVGWERGERVRGARQ